MFKKLLSLIPVLLIGALLNGMVNTTLASAGMQRDEWRAHPEKMQEFIKTRLGKLSNRLEIKASQQPAWDAFSKAVEALAEHPVKRPDENADAAAVAHFRADMAADMANKLSAIAAATDKLQSVLDMDQRKVLDEETRRFRHGGEHERHEKDEGRHE